MSQSLNSHGHTFFIHNSREKTTWIVYFHLCRLSFGKSYFPHNIFHLVSVRIPPIISRFIRFGALLCNIYVPVYTWNGDMYHKLKGKVYMYLNRRHAPPKRYWQTPPPFFLLWANLTKQATFPIYMHSIHEKLDRWYPSFMGIKMLWLHLVVPLCIYRLSTLFFLRLFYYSLCRLRVSMQHISKSCRNDISRRISKFRDSLRNTEISNKEKRKQGV